MTRNSNTVGGLNILPSRTSGGKNIDEWSFVSPFQGRNAQDVAYPKLAVQVSLHKKSDGMHFVAAGTCLHEPLVDTDIDRLRIKVEAAFRVQHDIFTGVSWENWLEIRVSGRMNHRESNHSYTSELKIEHRRIKRGFDPKTGKAYCINMNGIAVNFPKDKKAGEYDEGEGPEVLRLSDRDVDSEFSYLPETPEAIAGLQDLMSRLVELRLKLSQFLRQDQISISLDGIAGRAPGLPAPL